MLGVILTLVGVLAPAIRISRPAGSAITQLKTTLQRARSEAIRNRTDTFVAFTDSLPEIEWNASTDAYRYRAYAIFSRDKSQLNPSNRYLTDVLTCPVKQVANWNQLPENVLFALGEDIHSLQSAEQILTLLDAGDPEESLGFQSTAFRKFPLKISGVTYQSNLPCIAFNSEGRVRLPSWNESHTLHLGLVGGSVRNGIRTITDFISEAAGASSEGKQIPIVDLLTISHATGHVREVGSSSTAAKGNNDG